MDPKEEIKKKLKEGVTQSWFRMWFWLFLEERRNKQPVKYATVIVHLSRWERIRRWWHSFWWRIHRARQQRRYASMTQAQRWAFEDAHLRCALSILRSRRPRTYALNRSVVRSVLDPAYHGDGVVPDCAFVDAICDIPPQAAVPDNALAVAMGVEQEVQAIQEFNDVVSKEKIQ